jgi:hypothetical protein
MRALSKRDGAQTDWHRMGCAGLCKARSAYRLSNYGEAVYTTPRLRCAPLGAAARSVIPLRR